MGIGIVAERVDVQLDGTSVLRDLSFDIQPGEFIAVIGPNGSGKTTLLKTLLGLVKPQHGEIRFPGTDNEARNSTLVGYAPQSRIVDPDSPLRAWDFVSFGLPHKFRPWLTKRDKQQIESVMRATDTERFKKRSIGKLSGGERQRLFVAQALLRKPGILLLDEPTSNLDLGAQQILVEAVKKVNEDRGITVVLVTHDVNLLINHADRILYIAHGQAVLGRPDDILRSDVLTRIYGSPVNVAHVGGQVFITTSEASQLQPATHLHLASAQGV